MTKKNKIVLIVLSAVLALALAFFALTGNEKIMGKLMGGISLDSGVSLASLQPAEFQSDYPLVQTVQKDLFYEAFPDGSFKFYKYADGTFTPVTDGVKTKKIKVTCSGENVPVKLHYLKTDSGTVGYGLFTAEQETDVHHFSYIFFRMADCPASYKSTAKTSHVLLADMDAQDSYKTDKTYSDIYSLDISSGKTMLVVSQRDRTLQEDATYSEQWTVFTDSSLNTMKKYDFFASARYHDVRADEITYDIMSVANSRQSRRANSTTLDGSPSYTIREKDGAYFCFVNTDDGFDLVKNAKKDKPLASFSGAFSDYAVSGNWILNKKTFEMTDITSGKSTKLKKASLEEFSGFTVNESGTKAAVFGSGESSDTAVFYNIDADAVQVVTDEIFDAGICNYCFVGDVIVVSTYKDGGAVNRAVGF